MAIRRTYKDSLFRHIFKDKTRLLSLYNALTGSTLEDARLIKFNTLKSVLFSDLRNDLSFQVGDKFIVLLEHQSTVNANMPLRMLFYIARLYQKMIPKTAPYRHNTSPLPAPEFFVLYNGTEVQPMKQILKLSDAYPVKSTNLELLVTVYNINFSQSSELLQTCADLRGYSMFIEYARQAVKNGKTEEQAIRAAIRYCKSHDMLTDFFNQNPEKEVVDMVSLKWDYATALEAAREDGMEQGIKQGMEQGMERGIKRGAIMEIIRSVKNIMDGLGYSVTQAMDLLKIPMELRPDVKAALS